MLEGGDLSVFLLVRHGFVNGGQPLEKGRMGEVEERVEWVGDRETKVVLVQLHQRLLQHHAPV